MKKWIRDRDMHLFDNRNSGGGVLKRLVFGLTVMLIFSSLCGCSKEESIDRERLSSDLRVVQKLVLSRMTVSKMATIDDISLSEAKGGRQKLAALIASLKPGTRKAAYSYNTYLYAYVDLSQLTVDDVRAIDNHTIEITLPPIEVAIEGRDVGITENHYRVTGLRSHIDASERAQLKEAMSAALREEVAEDPTFETSLKSEARKKLDLYFDAFAKSHGIDIRIKYPSGTPDDDLSGKIFKGFEMQPRQL